MLCRIFWDWGKEPFLAVSTQLFFTLRGVPPANACASRHTGNLKPYALSLGLLPVTGGRGFGRDSMVVGNLETWNHLLVVVLICSNIRWLNCYVVISLRKNPSQLSKLDQLAWNHLAMAQSKIESRACEIWESDLQMDYKPVLTWRVILVDKWIGSPPCSTKTIWKGNNASWGLTNHDAYYPLTITGWSSKFSHPGISCKVQPHQRSLIWATKYFFCSFAASPWLTENWYKPCASKMMEKIVPRRS